MAGLSQAHDTAARPRVMGLPPLPQQTLYGRILKPVSDRILAAVLLVLALPVMAIVALGVWATLGSPVLLRQRRVGEHGVVFDMLKFRTMHPCRRQNRSPRPPDDHERRVTHKSPHDPRLTRLGRLLRKMSLDELPQLWHVLRGQMSLVGPRPELMQIVQSYEPWQHRRHVVKPGLTGLWQVTERGSGRLMHEHVDLDLAYIGQISLKTDLRILLRTAALALGGGRGY